jgi:hypothetical protein
VDPEDNEFCVLNPHPRYATGSVAAILVEAHALAELASFWSTATGWPIEVTNDEVIALRSPRGQWLEILHEDHEIRAKDRLRFDLAPCPDTDQATALAQLVDTGAVLADVGRHQSPRVMLTDPEGHEFCLLSSH